MRGCLILGLFVLFSLVLSGCDVKTSTSTSSSGGFGGPISVSKKVPAIGETSTKKDITVYVSHYQHIGYQITTNQQVYKPDGTIQSFHFAANRSQGGSTAKVTADIDSVTHNISTSEDSTTN